MPLFDATVFQGVYIGFSTLSAFLSGSVVVTSMMRPRLMISTTKPFSHILFFISFSDFIGSIANSFGFPLANSSLCACQGFLILFFFRASWLWALALVFQLRCVMINKKLWFRIRWTHWICWGVSIFLTLLPLSTQNSYGLDDYGSGFGTCNLGGSNLEAAIVWNDITFVGLGIGVIFLMLSWRAEVGYLYRTNKITLGEGQLAIYNAMRFYPLGIVLTWLPVFVFGIVQSFIIEGGVVVKNQIAFLNAGAVFTVLSTQYGTILGVVFYSQSHVAREVWRSFLCPRAQDAAGPGTSVPASLDESQWSSVDDEEVIIRGDSASAVLELNNGNGMNSSFLHAQSDTIYVPIIKHGD